MLYKACIMLKIKTFKLINCRLQRISHKNMQAKGHII